MQLDLDTRSSCYRALTFTLSSEHMFKCNPYTLTFARDNSCRVFCTVITRRKNVNLLAQVGCFGSYRRFPVLEARLRLRSWRCQHSMCPSSCIARLRAEPFTELLQPCQ